MIRETAVIRRILYFIKALCTTWGGLLTGGFLIALVTSWQITGHSVSPRVGWTIIVLGLLAAAFQVWSRQIDRTEQLTMILQQETNKVLNVRRAIYKEILYLYANLLSLKKEVPKTDDGSQRMADFLKTLRIDAYEFAKSQSDIFSKLPESFKIDAVYNHLTVISTMESLHPQAILGLADAFIQTAEEAFRDPAFDLKLLNEIAREAKRLYGNKAAPQDNAGSAGSSR
jgi:hypothetical protein